MGRPQSREVTGGPAKSEAVTDAERRGTPSTEEARAISACDLGEPGAAGADAVEEALAEALRHAAQERRWEVVSQLARELEGRRLAKRDGNVISLDRRREPCPHLSRIPLQSTLLRSPLAIR